MTAFTQAYYPGMVGTSRQALRQYQTRRSDYLARLANAEARLLLHPRDYPT